MSILQFACLFVSALAMIALGGFIAVFGPTPATQWIGMAALMAGLAYALKAITVVGGIR